MTPEGIRRLGAAIAIGAFASGCSLLNREEYSLVIRKPAHVYQAADPGADPEAGGPASGLVEVGGGTRAYVPMPVLEPFRLFAYCHRHESSHVVESVVAIAVAPVELPVVLAVNTTSQVVRSLWVDNLSVLLRWILDPASFWRDVVAPADEPPLPARPPPVRQ